MTTIHDQFFNACIENNLDIAQKLWVTMCCTRKMKRKTKTREFIDKETLAFIRVCQQGHLNVAQWMHLIIPDIDIETEDGNECAFSRACEHMHFHVAHWLLSVKERSIHVSSMFQWACREGRLDIAQWMLSVKPTINISANEEYAFRMACDEGHLLVAQWLFSIKPTIDISAQNNFAFGWACDQGHLDVVKWLLVVKPDIDFPQEKTVLWSCKHNRFDMAEFLLSVKPENIPEIVSSVLLDSCYNGNLNAAQWAMISLQNVDDDIQRTERRAFEASCWAGHVNIATWLFSLRPFSYRLVLDPKTFKIAHHSVRKPEKARWSQRNYAMLMRQKIVHTIFYKMPEDVSRFVIQMFL